MSIDDGIPIRKILLVMIIHKYTAAFIRFSIDHVMKIVGIVRSFCHRITDVKRRNLYPGNNFRVDALQTLKVHLKKCKR